MIENLRNIAIIAHVDHGKTTLVDELLKQSGTLGERFGKVERVMDSNDQERERGITILSKNTAIRWKDYRINIVDTPGHADFGGEVERVLSMVDSVLLLVDAQEGPMPQTRFVTQKAFNHGLRPIVVVNKIDKPGARPDWVIDQVFELFDRLGATDDQLDFPIVCASAVNGYAGLENNVNDGDMKSLFETIVKHCPAPDVNREGSFKMQISNLDYNSYVGAIAVGRVTRGTVRPNQQVTVVKYEGKQHRAKIGVVYGYLGLERFEVKEANAGDIIAISGMEAPNVSDTLCDPELVEAMPPLTVDEPTVSMTFQVNTSPFAGKEGKYLTSRQLKERLERELIHNVALRVEEGIDPEKFKVSGRGELHLSVLIENMRREGFELAVSCPEVIFREVDGEVFEPYEQLTVDVEEKNQGSIMEAMGMRKGELKDMVPDGKGRVRLDYIIPSRGLIGFQTEFMTSTSGTGLIYHVFDHYGVAQHGDIAPRKNGVLISNGQGKVLGFALFNLQERGRLFSSPGDEVYEGQIVGIHARDNDLVVNPLKGKQLTNVRASGKDDAIMLTTPLRYSLEQALEFVEDDELVEVTPSDIRIRKKHLKEFERKRASRE
ncbi:MAG: translational GTPase TypA [Candidatus Thiodiazotropha sp. (ex Lucinoma aequizonata)]|nr:translational GTPase TypA [Candidatus Thiodiazotropha sp. (ex Lucinoma aequizonata)]MCU7888208.1 translational GTPase TypA [Candidatus Thiodiazotropha sp. (ex Lucinoma aequizonata)]MCU7895999.1 translational GTPase TypA [Candidatus Thiodiazotropha sp. (ex Lucinoma aequizonata)]MCU7899041.1 translational GTPase TypA [Candidatus Thiodiazotropha sp. (ex Lucinoma aequizonata)]MCU7903013.1 translational GTPase TypA [Candidatus Thiodiazotropha sp. (ex Lucinoma aequizonata)]